MRYFVIAGEASGDLHGAGLVGALLSHDPDAVIQAWGGDAMQRAGARVLKHYRELAFMGFIEVIRNLHRILRNFREVKHRIRKFQPDALILIDYPGFNLRMAKWAHRQDIPVHYYISPQLWAWKENRVEIVRKYVNRMYVILPFEQAFYKNHGIDVTYVGHPLLEAISRFTASHPEAVTRGRTIALIAGSRVQEVKHMLPVMLEVAEALPDHTFRIAAAPHVPEALYHDLIRKARVTNVRVLRDATYDIMRTSEMAITTSGTATLETALFHTPQVVGYKGNAFSFEIARRLVKVPFISLVNLIAGRPVVEELIQHNYTAPRVIEAMDRLRDPDMREEVLAGYASLAELLDEGGASDRVAEEIISSLKTARHASVQK